MFIAIAIASVHPSAYEQSPLSMRVAALPSEGGACLLPSRARFRYFMARARSPMARARSPMARARSTMLRLPEFPLRLDAEVRC